MRKEMNLDFDGIGFINNRGKSKYWGISQDIRNHWVVSVWTPHDDDYRTKTFYFHGCRPSEIEAANVAYQLYKYRDQAMPSKSFELVATTGKTYIVNPNTNSITKAIKGLVTPPVQTSMSFSEQLKASNQFSSKEKQLVQNLVDGFMSNDISPEGVKLIQKLTSIMNS